MKWWVFLNMKNRLWRIGDQQVVGLQPVVAPELSLIEPKGEPFELAHHEDELLVIIIEILCIF